MGDVRERGHEDGEDGGERKRIGERGEGEGGLSVAKPGQVGDDKGLGAVIPQEKLRWLDRSRRLCWRIPAVWIRL